MGFDPIPKSVRNVWDAWNIRGFIILSLSLQIILVFSAPFRKRTSNKYVTSLLWSAYLLADWVAAFALGLIVNSQGGGSVSPDYGGLLAFWAPFLLFHLGGPDTITAFSLEDNELWLRHLIGLLVQVSAAFYVFLLTLPRNKLVTSTILMLLAGIIKYTERTRALYLASLDSFKESMLKEPDPGPNYAKFMDEYDSNKEAMLPTRIEMIRPTGYGNKTTTFNRVGYIFREDDAVDNAYQFFEIFKGLIVDLVFSFPTWNKTRSFFQGRTADDGYKVILMELNFMYDALYTKAIMAHSSKGYVVRFFSFSLSISALVIFTELTKVGFHRIDVIITYTLLVAGIALDSIAILMTFFSEWTFAKLKYLVRRDQSEGGFVDSFIIPIVSSFFTRKIPRTSKIKLRNRIEYDVLDTPVLYRRWGESISAYNLIGHCIKEQPRKIHQPMGCFGYMVHKIGIAITSPFRIIVKLLQYLKFFFVTLGQCCCCQFGLVGPLYVNLMEFFKGIFMILFDQLHISGFKAIYEQMRYVSKNAFVKQLWELIFQELIDKSHFGDDPGSANIIYRTKGGWVLRGSSLGIDHTKVELLQFVENVEYDESILLWHIATDLCYYTEDEESPTEGNHYREFSKMLSDYMLYLLVMQTQMMSAVAGIGQIRFRDTFAEAERFFNMRGRTSFVSREGKMQQACEMILEVSTYVKPVAVKGDRSKSVLFDACILAKELKKLEIQQKKNKWEVMCKVWIEILCYAASHCRPASHAQVLNKGGELITLVWLLTAHLGIGEQFQMHGTHARMRLVVGK